MASQGPLSGVRIIDITSVLMGPYATQIMGDFGAEVIKVEPPAGDISRGVGPMRSPGMGAIFLHVNRNKRSLVLDLKKPGGVEALLMLARRADVFLYNIRPRALARLGISYERLREANPKIICVGLVGYGQDGPYAAKPAYDDLVQGAAAIPALVQAAGGKLPRYAPVTLSDRAVALNAANVVLAALYSREKTGRGQEIQLPMFETMVQFVMGDHLGGLTFEPRMGPAGYTRLLAHDRRPYATRDGHICVMVYTDKNWRDFLAFIGKPDVFDTDPRFATIGKRTENIGALYGMISDAMKTRTSGEWLEILDRMDIAAMPMNTPESLVEDPHLRAVNFFRIVEHPTEGTVREMAIPSTWSHTKPSIRRQAPRLGEHSVEILRDAGLDEQQIQDLLDREVTRSAQ